MGRVLRPHLHGRTREQRYSSASRIGLTFIAAPTWRQKSEFTLIGNGDVYTYEDYNAQVADNKVATCMIGRGAIIKPWLMTEIKEQRHWDISANERLDLFKDFCQYGLEHWGSDSMGVEKTRRYLLEWMSYTHRYVPIGLLGATRCSETPLAPHALRRTVGLRNQTRERQTSKTGSKLSEMCGLG